jgi:hypothetical protein
MEFLIGMQKPKIARGKILSVRASDAKSLTVPSIVKGAPPSTGRLAPQVRKLRLLRLEASATGQAELTASRPFCAATRQAVPEVTPDAPWSGARAPETPPAHAVRGSCWATAQRVQPPDLAAAREVNQVSDVQTLSRKDYRGISCPMRQRRHGSQLSGENPKQCHPLCR